MEEPIQPKIAVGIPHTQIILRATRNNKAMTARRMYEALEILSLSST